MSNNIAVGVGKKDTMWKGHFGISPIYKIYNRNGEFIEERVNPHSAEHNHDNGDGQPKVIKELLHDCSTFIGKRMGEESKLKLAKKLGIETVLYKTNDPVEALNTYLGK